MSAFGVRRLVPRFSLRTLVVFLLLVTSGVGLWWHWEPWHVVTSFEASDVSEDVGVGDEVIDVAFSSNQDLVWARVATEKGLVDLKLDPTWGQVLGSATSAWAIDDSDKRLAGHRRVSSPDGRRGLIVMPGRFPPHPVRPEAPTWHIKDMMFTRVLWQFGQYDEAALSPDGLRVILGDRNGRIVLCRRRRPEWWWGVFYLWEFWLTVVFAGLFVWSVVRDRRVLDTASAAV